MNPVECYILEVLEENKYGDYVTVKMKIDCYGAKEITEHTTTIDQWEKERKQGYFLA